MSALSGLAVADASVAQSQCGSGIRPLRDSHFLLITGIKIPYYEVPNQFIERRGVSHGV